jgi:hypothetical protein
MVSPLSMTVAQKFIPVEVRDLFWYFLLNQAFIYHHVGQLWVPFFSLIQFGLGVCVPLYGMF